MDFSSPGGNYENIMKVNMATGKMPDAFTTHGWSVKRYQKYLLPLNNLSFAKNISGSIRPIITNSSGFLLVLPIDIDISGILYNPGVLQKAGVSADRILTWDDFTAACRQIKESGYGPICIAGREAHSAGEVLNRLSLPFFVTDEKENQRTALQSGKFDASTWEKAAGMMELWRKMGYYNSDAQDCDYIGCIKETALGHIRQGRGLAAGRRYFTRYIRPCKIFQKFFRRIFPGRFLPDAQCDAFPYYQRRRIFPPCRWDRHHLQSNLRADLFYVQNGGILVKHKCRPGLLTAYSPTI